MTRSEHASGPSFIVEIHAGRGPAEVCAFVDSLAQRIGATAQALGLTVSKESHASRLGGSRSIRLRLSGASALPEEFLAQRGTHALLNAARGRGARKRWFAGVEIWPEGKAAALDPAEVAFEVCRSGGPGGQHVNRTESAVRATHVPTGLSVRAEQHRSQHRNKVHALALLSARVIEARRAALLQEERAASLRGHRFDRGQAVRTYQLDSRGRLIPEREAGRRRG